MTAVLFLDLEETVIDDWWERNLLIDRIRAIKKNVVVPGNFDCLGLFSWAITHNKDLTEFNQDLREPLQNMLGLKFNSNFMVTIHHAMDMMSNRRRFHRDLVTETEFHDFMSHKNTCFLECVLELNEVTPMSVATLVDDTVFNAKMLMTNPHIEIEWVNPITAWNTK